MRTCRHCGKSIPEDTKYCPFCGETLPNHQNRKGTIAIITTGVLALISIGLIFYHVGRHSNKSRIKITYNNAGSIDTSAMFDSTMPQADENSSSGTTSLNKTNESASDKKTEKTDDITMQQAEVALAQIDNTISRYVGVVLMKQKQDGINQKSGDSFAVLLTDAEKIRAAALASAPDGVIDGVFREDNIGIVFDENAMYGPNGDGYHGVSVASKSVERNCRNLFGTEANWEELQIRENCHLYDAVKYTDSAGTHAVLIDKGIESEIEQSSIDYRIREDNGNYTGEVDLFWGYWGDLKNNPGISNYKIEYELIPNEKSEYGLVISSMRIMKTVAPGTDTQSDSHISDKASSAATVNNPDPITETTPKQPFYGVWCYASKNPLEAQSKADELSQRGLDGRVFISSEWSNLNQERWYCTSAGVSLTEADAEIVLETALNAGYSDAYIKYSGEYTG